MQPLCRRALPCPGHAPGGTGRHPGSIGPLLTGPPVPPCSLQPLHIGSSWQKSLHLSCCCYMQAPICMPARASVQAALQPANTLLLICVAPRPLGQSSSQLLTRARKAADRQQEAVAGDSEYFALVWAVLKPALEGAQQVPCQSAPLAAQPSSCEGSGSGGNAAQPACNALMLQAPRVTSHWHDTQQFDWKRLIRQISTYLWSRVRPKAAGYCLSSATTAVRSAVGRRLSSSSAVCR